VAYPDRVAERADAPTATLPARDAATTRVHALFAEFGRLGREDLAAIVVPGPDSVRHQARERAVAAAREAGLGDLLDAAREAVREGTLSEFGDAMYRPTWIDLNWAVSMGTARDRVAVVGALDDAMIATVAHDRISDADREALWWAYERVAGLARGRASTESLAAASDRYRSGPARVVLAVVTAVILVSLVILAAPALPAGALILGLVLSGLIAAALTRGSPARNSGG